MNDTAFNKRFFLRLSGPGLVVRGSAVLAPLLSGLGASIIEGSGAELMFLSLVALMLIACEFVARREWGEWFFLFSVMSAFALPFVTLVLPSTPGGIVTEGDAYWYDAVARHIANTVSLRNQLDPFDFSYVHTISDSLGFIVAAPGFYKGLGVLYTLAHAIGVDGAWAAVDLNICAMSCVGTALSTLTRQCGAAARSASLAAAAFVLQPVSADQVFTVRKDVTVLLLVVVIVLGAVRRNRWTLILGFAALTVLRMAYAAILVAWAATVLVSRSWRVQRKPAWGFALLLSFVLVWSFIQLEQIGLSSLFAMGDSAAADRSLFWVDLSGFSGWLLSSWAGRIAFSLFSPVPGSSVKDIPALYRNVSYGATAIAVVVVVARIAQWRGRISQEQRPFVLGWLLLATQMVVLTRVAVDQGLLSIAEPRYKLAWWFLTGVLLAPKASSRTSVTRRLARANLAPIGSAQCAVSLE